MKSSTLLAGALKPRRRKPPVPVFPGVTLSLPGRTLELQLVPTAHLKPAIRRATADRLDYAFAEGVGGYLIEAGTTSRFSDPPQAPSLRLEPGEPVNLRVAAVGGKLPQGTSLNLITYDAEGRPAGTIVLPFKPQAEVARLALAPRAAVMGRLAVRLTGAGRLPRLKVRVAPAGNAAVRRALSAFDRGDMRAFFAVEPPADPGPEDLAGRQLAAVHGFLAAYWFLTPDLARERGLELLALHRADPFLPRSQVRRLYNRLSAACAKVGRVDEALDLIDQAVSLRLYDARTALALRADLMVGKAPREALAALEQARRAGVELSPAQTRVLVMLTLQQRGWRKAEAVLAAMPLAQDEEAAACAYNIALRREGLAAAQPALGDCFTRHGLAAPRLAEGAIHAGGVSLAEPPAQPARAGGPLVTVIMTAFDAAATLRGALGSVLDQTHRALEVLVVDDASADDTPAVLAELAAADPRVRVLRNGCNVGTYLSRNRAMSQARGEFVTFHDSDDWCHPQRIAAQLAAMQADPALAVCRSQWLRVAADGAVPLRRWARCFAHLNPSSLFIRRGALDRLGFFDAVRADADTEYGKRLELLLAPGEHTLLPAVHALGFLRRDSLTWRGAGAVDEENFSPVRTAYKRAWSAGYVERLRAGGLALPPLPRAYGYDVPEGLRSPLGAAAPWFDDDAPA